MLSKGLWKSGFFVVTAVLVASLWFNYQSYRRHVRVHSWKHFAYNDFIAGVVGGAHSLGWKSEKDPNRAAMQIGEAAMALEQMSAYEDITTTQTTSEMRDQYSVQNPVNVEDVTHYLSYAAMIIADPDEAVHPGDIPAAEKFVVEVAQLLFKEASSHGVLNDIPDTLANHIFTQMCYLIPPSYFQLPQATFFEMS